MLIGVPKEIKNNERRVGLVPESVAEIVAHGHKVLVETMAGSGIGMDDAAYIAAGASIALDAKEVFTKADMIVKVKEPQAVECAMLKPEQILFTYLHLAPDPIQTKALIDSGCIAVAYETITQSSGGLPLLAPMSEVAGRMAIQVGAAALEGFHGGRGILLGGVPGVEPGKVTILGGGVAGTNAMAMAVGLGAQVVVIDRDPNKLKHIDEIYKGRVQTVYSTSATVKHHVLSADLVIGTVLIPGAAAPKLITRELVKGMKKGSVIIDVAVDQGGCAQTTHATTHEDPTYVVDGVVHYCVANMPGGVARTSTLALNNATLPYVLRLADGQLQALLADQHFLNGLNIYCGAVTHQAVARDLGLSYVDPTSLLSIKAA
ncbi:MAG: alanine dehydrogenase [Magnetovibrio sp.]|nr:alanine dehydrogenase [Magnetovibrio sp.]